MNGATALEEILLNGIKHFGLTPWKKLFILILVISNATTVLLVTNNKAIHHLNHPHHHLQGIADELTGLLVSGK